MKIVLNRDYGGYCLSKAAADFLGISTDRFEKAWGSESPTSYAFKYDRTNPRLIEAVEVLGKEASGPFASLEVINIPDRATDYTIVENDGWEEIYFVVDGRIYRN